MCLILDVPLSPIRQKGTLGTLGWFYGEAIAGWGGYSVQCCPMIDIDKNLSATEQ